MTLKAKVGSIFFLLFFFALLNLPVSAKTVVCIDDGDDFRYAEGYYRQTLGPNDVIQVGGSLADCYCNVEAGDEFIVVGHGRVGGGAFRWGGTWYGGFRRQGSNDPGTGVNGDPYELPAKELDGITVSLWFCHADSNPAGETTTSTTSTMDSIINYGDGSGEVWGPDGLYQIGDYHWRFDRAPADQINRARQCLYDAAEAAGFARSDQGVSDWINSLSYNDQQTIPQQVLAECEDIPNINFSITYTPLSEQGKSQPSPIFCDEIDYGDGTLEVFCDVDGPTICLEPEGGDIPTLSEWGLIILGVVLLGFITYVFFKRRKAAVSLR